MLITREIDYALRILRAISDGKLRSIQEICNREATPKQFAYRIIKKLERMGWISITRGVEGGCMLKVDLCTVNLYQLIEEMGNGRNISECLQDGYTCTRQSVCDENCTIHAELEKIQRNFHEELKQYSIYSLISGDTNQ